MSASSQAMQSLLAQKLMQPSQSSSYGGGVLGPQMQGQTSPLGAASQMAQKIMLMRALQGQPQGQPPTQVPPQPNPMGGVNAIPQQMNQQPVPGGTNA